MTRSRTPSLILACVLVLLPMYEAGYLSPLDAAISTGFDSVLSPSTTADALAPPPRELALRRLVDKTAALLASEGRRIDKRSLMDIARIADRVGLQNHLPPSLILSVIHTESQFQRDVISSGGAVGLMQVQLATARSLAGTATLAQSEQLDLQDPETNILIGTSYLRQLIDRFGDLRTALAAYHVGPTEIGRRLDVREPFSDYYSREIRDREYYFTTSSSRPVVLPASVRG